MALDQVSKLRRLSFIRYLFHSGIAQSHAPAPLNASSLLTLHDAIELFLQLASEHLNAGKKDLPFMEYFTVLNRELDPDRLSQQEAMRRLNRSRAALKHDGLLPSAHDVESFRAVALAFFAENTPLVFGIALDDVSLIEFVAPESARKSLREAQGMIDTGELADAMNPIALAYHDVVRSYRATKSEWPSRDPFEFGGTITSLNHLRQSLPEVVKFAEETKRTLEAMQNAIRVLALGIDFRRFSRFERFTPEVLSHYTGDVALHQHFRQDLNPSIEDAQFCLDFVVESALVLAEFDYSVTGALGLR